MFLKRYSQFRMSEMKTASPRMPSPFTVGILFVYWTQLAHLKLHTKQQLIRRMLVMIHFGKTRQNTGIYICFLCTACYKFRAYKMRNFITGTWNITWINTLHLSKFVTIKSQWLLLALWWQWKWERLLPTWHFPQSICIQCRFGTVTGVTTGDNRLTGTYSQATRYERKTKDQL